MKTTLPLCFTFLSFGLLAVAQNNTSDATTTTCMDDCMPLRNEIFVKCNGYDMNGEEAPTQSNVECICGLSGLEPVAAPCIDCYSVSDPAFAAELISFCDNVPEAQSANGNSTRTASPTTTVRGSNSNSTATTSRTTTTARATPYTNGTSTATSTITGSTTGTTTGTTGDSEPTTSASDAGASDTGAPNGASSFVPGIALALVLLVAQMGL